MEQANNEKCSCIECGKAFDSYPNTVCCHICDGEGYIESDLDEFMRDDYRLCWLCHGVGELTISERSFCDEDCREQYFENQIE